MIEKIFLTKYINNEKANFQSYGTEKINHAEKITNFPLRRFHFILLFIRILKKIYPSNFEVVKYGNTYLCCTVYF